MKFYVLTVSVFDHESSSRGQAKPRVFQDPLVADEAGIKAVDEIRVENDEVEYTSASYRVHVVELE